MRDDLIEDSVPSNLAIELIRRELQRRETQNKGYVLDGFPRSFAEAAGLFSKRKRETNEEEIFAELISQKTKQLKHHYARKKRQFFQRKAEALENSQINGENTDHSNDLDRKGRSLNRNSSRAGNTSGSNNMGNNQGQEKGKPNGQEEGMGTEGEREWGVLLEEGVLKKAAKVEWGEDEEEESGDEGIEENEDEEEEIGEKKLFVDEEVDVETLRQELEAEYDEEEAHKRMYSFQNSG